MKDVIEWLIQNKEWVFSGLGVAVIGFVFSKERTRNYLKAMFNYKSNVTQISIDNKGDEKE